MDAALLMPSQMDEQALLMLPHMLDHVELMLLSTEPITPLT